MSDQLDKEKREALRPLTDEKSRQEAHLSPDELEAAIERGRQALAEVQRAARPGFVISPKLRFS